MRSISSASSIKALQSLTKKQSEPKRPTLVQEYEIKEQVSHILNSSLKNQQKANEETKQPTFPPQVGASKKVITDGVDETLSSIYLNDSILNKRHDVSVVEADGILDQINSRMMKLHFEMVYKNIDKSDAQDDFSFEIDNTNNMIVPKNSNVPIKTKKFVQLPQREDLYKENELSDGQIQWTADTHTIRIFPHSPSRETASVAPPFTSPQTTPRSPSGTISSPISSSKPPTSTKEKLLSQHHNSSHYFEKSLLIK